VVFHGAFTFDQASEPDRILALMPDMPHHVYRAGSWLAETEIQRRVGCEAVVYELTGVKPGGAKFRPERNLMIKKQRQDPAETIPFATLTFPLPSQIASLQVAPLPRAAFTYPEQLLVDSDTQHIATVQIFTYDIADENALSLQARDGEGHYWEPMFTGNYINLHIFCAEDSYHKPTNAEEDFNQCAGLLSGVTLRMQTQNLPASRILDAGQLPDGVVQQETESLALRTRRMARLGQLVTQNGDTNLAWYGNDALDGDPEGCGGPVCG
jgi:hypothetical protein